MLPLLALALLALALGGCSRSVAERDRSARFHEVVGGLGGGLATDLTDGRAAFDARLGSTPFDGSPGQRSVAADLGAAARGDE